MPRLLNFGENLQKAVRCDWCISDDLNENGSIVLYKILTSDIASALIQGKVCNTVFISEQFR